jgi:hypothetical protein
MTDKTIVELGGESKYQVAHKMAREIIRFEGKTNFTRHEYLQLIYECMHVLNGNPPRSL